MSEKFEPTYTRKIKVKNERVWDPEKGLNFEGLEARMKKEGFTIQDIRDRKVSVREGGLEGSDIDFLADQIEEYQQRSTKVIDDTQKPEESLENPVLAQYKSDYKKWDSELKARISFEEIALRLQAREGHYLKLAQDLQEGGVLWGVDSEGNPLFADKGVEPVMKGMSYNKAFGEIYGEEFPDPKDYPKKKYEEKMATYMKSHTGYEMFDKEEDVRAVEKFTGEPFVASKNREDYRSSHLFSGKNPSWSRYAIFFPYRRNVYLYGNYFPASEDVYRGVRRLLRVKKFES